ncbi:amino acid ABC transporter substrate-binding protein [Martelella mediterranea]|uniref:Glutamate/aspartate periplasmic-binding protein n=1 Tax=Martelella mediterranea DSM 17316 TaxID=1122214 RepID=A0A1U9Z9R8_9HYPH|nr:amino acid ABC transporter substrate-binding protein [Martelella mediterranea]AQZ54453.1 Glutamate/aspartate periplasmic-binding protein precursor [Martelella mediterranea DSM 17316]
MKFRTLSAVAMMAASLLSSTVAFAQSSDAVIDRIREKNAISIGYREASIPFSYIDKEGRPVGYSTDLCKEVAETVKTALDLPDLKIEWVPVNLQNRIPLVANGTVDISCESAVNTIGRQSQVDFSNPFFISHTRFLVKAGSGIAALADLDGKSIALPINSVPERLIKSLVEKDDLNVRIVPVKDNSEGFLALQTGRADAFSTDDILLFGLKNKAVDPAAYEVVGKPLSYDSYGFLVQKNSTVFLTLVNATLARLSREGELQALYGQWFDPMGVPLSPDLATVFHVIAIPE